MLKGFAFKILAPKDITGVPFCMQEQTSRLWNVLLLRC